MSHACRLSRKVYALPPLYQLTRARRTLQVTVSVSTGIRRLPPFFQGGSAVRSLVSVAVRLQPVALQEGPIPHLPSTRTPKPRPVVCLPVHPFGITPGGAYATPPLHQDTHDSSRRLQAYPFGATSGKATPLLYQNTHVTPSCLPTGALQKGGHATPPLY